MASLPAIAFCANSYRELGKSDIFSLYHRLVRADQLTLASHPHPKNHLILIWNDEVYRYQWIFDDEVYRPKSIGSLDFQKLRFESHPPADGANEKSAALRTINWHCLIITALRVSFIRHANSNGNHIYEIRA
jgi:hypothetical protein